MGRPTGGDSIRSRKAYSREIQMLEKHNMLKIERGLPHPEISFGVKDDRSLAHPHEDALVITVGLERYEVKRVFVDTGAAANVIFEDCFKQMDIQKPLNSVTTALHGFTGDLVMSLGSIELKLTLGEGDLQVSRPVAFLVVRQKSSYNIILGRTALNSFQAMVSTYHLMMKFPIGNCVGSASGDQVMSRRCYVQSVKTGEARKRIGKDLEHPRSAEGLEDKKIKVTDPLIESCS